MEINIPQLKTELETLVTIIIPSRGIDSLLEICIKEIRKLYAYIPILLVLDYISDEELKKLPEKVNVIQSKKKSISSKRNLGVNQVVTKYVAFIDSDAYPKEGWLENSISFLENNSSYSAVTGAQLHPPTDSFMQRCLRMVRYTPIFTHKEWLIIIDKKAIEQDCTYAVTANMVIKTEDYIALGGLNEQIYLAEDNEFCDRLISSGGKMRFIPSVTIYHRERPFKQFLYHIFSMSSYYSNAFKKGLKIKKIKQSVMQFMPLAGILFFLFLWFLLIKLKINPFPLLLLPLLAIFILFIEAMKSAKKLDEKKFKGFIYIFFTNILFCAAWVLGILWGIVQPSSYFPYDTYKH